MMTPDSVKTHGNGQKLIPNKQTILSSIKIKQRAEEDTMIHKIAKEVAQEYLS